MRGLLNKFFKDESGATAIEYGIFAALISVVIITAVGTIGTELDTAFDSVVNALNPPEEP